MIGQLVVNLPVLLIILSTAGIGVARTYRLASVLAWFPDWGFIFGALLSIMVGALLVWPKGSPFEKTEFHLKD